MTTPSVWQTLVGREMRARNSRFESPGGQFKYWMTPLERHDVDSHVIGTAKNNKEILVAVGELNLTSSPSSGHMFSNDQAYVNASASKSGDYWTQAQLYDQNTLLSIGTQITSEMAFLTMFNEWGRIEGGKTFGAGEYSSEALYGAQRYPKDDVPGSGGCDEGRKLPFGCPSLSDSAVLDASPEADQARITPAYQLDREEAREHLRTALAARNAAGCLDCSTCPELLIFDQLWLGNAAFLATKAACWPTFP